MLEFLEKPGLVIVILVALVVFGSKRLPDSARALGRSMRILKAEAKGLKEDGSSSEPTPVPQAITPPAPVAAVVTPLTPSGIADPSTIVTPVEHTALHQH